MDSRRLRVAAIAAGFLGVSLLVAGTATAMVAAPSDVPIATAVQLEQEDPMSETAPVPADSKPITPIEVGTPAIKCGPEGSCISLIGTDAHSSSTDPVVHQVAGDVDDADGADDGAAKNDSTAVTKKRPQPKASAPAPPPVTDPPAAPADPSAAKNDSKNSKPSKRDGSSKRGDDAKHDRGADNRNDDHRWHKRDGDHRYPWADRDNWSDRDNWADRDNWTDRDHRHDRTDRAERTERNERGERGGWKLRDVRDHVRDNWDD